MTGALHEEHDIVIRIRPIEVEGVGLRWKITRGENLVAEVISEERAIEVARSVWPGSTIKIESLPVSSS